MDHAYTLDMKVPGSIMGRNVFLRAIGCNFSHFIEEDLPFSCFLGLHQASGNGWSRICGPLPVRAQRYAT